jgi:hypothetical protein
MQIRTLIFESEKKHLEEIRMKARNWFLSIGAMAVLFLTVSVSAWAQSAEPTEPATPPPHHGGAMFERMGPGPDGMGFVGFEVGLNGKTVTGTPFTASFSTQTTETLTDGNKIERNTTGTVARDSAGRTRRDMTLAAIGPWAASGKTPPQVSFINDPVAGTRYVLEANTRTAHKMSGRNRGPDAARSAGMAAKFQKNTTTESLGTQTINGVSAQGTRTTRTIPAGEMGNEKPIAIVKETWYSPELQITVMTKRTDPRTGETVSQLTNIQKQEPAATLFQVPSDYSVKEGRGPRGTNAGPAPAPSEQ